MRWKKTTTQSSSQSWPCQSGFGIQSSWHERQPHPAPHRSAPNAEHETDPDRHLLHRPERRARPPAIIAARPERQPASAAPEPCPSRAMPSIEETCVLTASLAPLAAPTAASAATARPDFFARDMEELVSEIKENLRLSSGVAGLKSRPTFAVQHKSARPSPYRIPSRSRSWGDPNHCDACAKAGAAAPGRGLLCCGHSCKKTAKVEADDPYEMLQELLRDGGLIKEAVRRLGMGLSPKQRYFYDSDEDTRSPIRMCHVEL